MRDYTNCDNTVLGMVHFFSTIQIRTDETFQRFKSSARFDNAGEILTPDNRATSSVTYTVGDWSVFWRARYWDRSKDSNTPELFNENDCFCALGLAPSANEVPSYVHNDFSVSYNRDRGPFFLYRVFYGSTSDGNRTDISRDTMTTGCC